MSSGLQNLHQVVSRYISIHLFYAHFQFVHRNSWVGMLKIPTKKEVLQKNFSRLAEVEKLVR